MKVLITGGYGFIGSHVAERFHKEGYEVYIIDNLSRGKKNNIKIKHKFYRLNVQDEKCTEIFESINFDVVVHLAAHVDVKGSEEEPDFDAESNVLGLINMLKLSSQYNVNKFIFASSAALYGDVIKLPSVEEDASNPISPNAVSKLAGEHYCRLWKNKYGLNTICLRFSNVYGPRQLLDDKSGVIPTFMRNIFSGEKIVVHGSGEQTRDFIYVLDVVDAIYKSAEFCSSDILNVSVNKQRTINNLVDILKALHTTKKVQFFLIGGSLFSNWKPQTIIQVEYTEAKPDDRLDGQISNDKAITELNWVPRYDLEQGLEKTYQWYKQNYQKKTQKKKKIPKKKNKDKKSLLKRILPYLENIAAFMFVIFLSKYSKQYDVATFLDFKLLYIIVIGIVYGLKQTTIAIILSCGLFVFELGEAGQDIISLIYNVNTLIYFSLYIFIGTVLGYSIDSKKIELDMKNDEIREIKDKFKFLYEMYDESKVVRKELQNQIISTEDSFGKIYKITSALDALETEKVFSETVRVIEEIMKSKDVYIFSVSKEQNYLRLISNSKGSNLDVAKSIKVDDYDAIKNLIRTKEIYVNKDLNSALPMMMSPIVVKEQVLAIIGIYSMEFETLSLYNQNLLKVISDLIKSSLARAYKYNEAILDEKYYHGTTVLKSDYFEELLYSKMEAKEKNNTDFVLLKVAENEWEIGDFPNKIRTTIREFDYIGVNAIGELFILLSNTKEEEARYVVNRLGNMAVHTEIIKKDEYYDSVTGRSLVG